MDIPDRVRRVWRAVCPFVPTDLAVVILITVVTTAAVVFPGVNQTPIQVVVVSPFVLFVPGYVIIAAYVPEAVHAQETPRIDLIDRFLLSVGGSIAVLSVAGVCLTLTPWGVDLRSVVVSLTGVVAVATAVGAHRRHELPENDRFVVPVRQYLERGLTEFSTPGTPTDLVLNVLGVLIVLVAVGSVAYAIIGPQGESFTDFYLLTQNESGELVAKEYPTELVVGEGTPLVVGIRNHERSTVEYTVITQLQRVTIGANATRVDSRRTLSGFNTTVAANETWQRSVTVTPTMTGTRLRLAFLLYKGEPPTRPTLDNAYREAHLWVNVSRGNASATPS